MTQKLKTWGLIATLVVGAAATFVACSEGHNVPPEQGDVEDSSADGSGVADASIDASNSQECGYEPYDAGPTSYNFWEPAPGPIVYWGGPIIQSPNIYLIWYGDWLQANPRSQVIEDLVGHFGGSEYSDIMKGYWQNNPAVQPDEAGAAYPQPIDAGGDVTQVTSNYKFAQSVYVGYTHGVSLQAGDAIKIVTDELNNGDLSVDPYGVYFIMTSADVSETMDDNYYLCNDYCGYHDMMTYKGSNLVYSVVGDPSSCIRNCTVLGALGYCSEDAGGPLSPNGDWGVDGMASVLIHELCESTTDPFPNYPGSAWQDDQMSQEVGDMCAWRFEPTYTTSDGAKANVHWGDRDYLIQQMWVNDNDGGGCALHP